LTDGHERTCTGRLGFTFRRSKFELHWDGAQLALSSDAANDGRVTVQSGRQIADLRQGARVAQFPQIGKCGRCPGQISNPKAELSASAGRS
jgi:hypothetical protein